jgi:hypothetical protein
MILNPTQSSVDAARTGFRSVAARLGGMAARPSQLWLESEIQSCIDRLQRALDGMRHAKVVEEAPYAYRVEPRYTNGSPALVSKSVAREVAQQEKAAYDRLMAGGGTSQERDYAYVRGLSGIVMKVQGPGKGYLESLHNLLDDEA